MITERRYPSSFSNLTNLWWCEKKGEKKKGGQTLAIIPSTTMALRKNVEKGGKEL